MGWRTGNELTVAHGCGHTVGAFNYDRQALSKFRDVLRSKDFVLTAEIPLHPAQSVGEIKAIVESLAPLLDAVQVTDNDAAEAHIAPLAAAKISLDAGLDPVVHMGGRDRNRIALQSDMLGLAALGVTSLLLKRGNKLPSTLKGRVRGVFDTRTAQMITMASRISENSSLVESPGFLIGSPVTVIVADPDWQAERVIEKLDSGVRFIQSRPTLDIDMVQDYARRLVELRLTHRASFIVTVPVLTSVADTLKLTDRWPASEVPEDALRRIGASKHSRPEAIASTATILQALKSTPGVAGVNLVFYSDTDAVAEAISLAGIWSAS